MVPAAAEAEVIGLASGMTPLAAIRATIHAITDANTMQV
jgi:hypothetical protein